MGYSIKMVCHLLLLGMFPFIRFKMKIGGCVVDELLAYLFFSNRYRDRKYGKARKEESDEAGMQDKTEFENMQFRYVL